jgi:hypothetical protein
MLLPKLQAMLHNKRILVYSWLHKEEGRKEGIIQELAPLCDFVLFCVVFPCDFCIVQQLRQQRTFVSIN